MEGFEQSLPSGRGNIDDQALEQIIEMVGDDPEVLIDLFETYLHESAGLIDSLRTALVSQDDRQLMIAAHSLKSASAVFGAVELAKLAGVLENAALGRTNGVNHTRQVDKIADEYGCVAKAMQAQLTTWRENQDL